MKKLIFIIVVILYACDPVTNEFTSFTGLWSTDDTEPLETAVISRKPMDGDLVVRFMVEASSGGTTVTEIPPCTIEISDSTDISQPYTYDLDGISLVVTFEDYETATVTADWNYVSGSVNLTGSNEYTLTHKYSSFRYDDYDDLIFDYFGM